MDLTTLVLILLFLFLSRLYLLNRNSRNKKLPPGPYAFPIIGNIYLLGNYPHRSLANLAKTYGPLISLQIGSIYTVVASSPKMVKEILQKHDHVFSSRVLPDATRAQDYDKFSIALLPVGKQWNDLRRICKEQIFSTHRLDASQGLRREKLRKLFEHLSKCCVAGRVVNVREIVFATSLNLISATLFSLDITDFDSNVTQKLKETIEGVVQILGASNVSDFFPILVKFDPQGIKREAEIHLKTLLDMFEDVINKRLESRGKCPKKQDLLEALLDLDQDQGSNYDLSVSDIKYLFVDLFVAGTDTTSTSVEWAMTELLINPNKMSKAKTELRTIIGDNRHVEESDISRLPYLQAVVKETLRLHPPAPLLVPHMALDDVELNGYTIPKDAKILINVWAMARLSTVWPNPNSFEPERFLDNKIDYKGQDLEFIPFGSGRRMCPGLPVAHRTLHLMLATLIHNFNWVLEPGMKQEDLNTDEKPGLVLHKAVPLKCVPAMARNLEPFVPNTP